METLPAELLLQIFQAVDTIRDKCQLSMTCRRFRLILKSAPWCWSPLNLSSYSEQINGVVLLTILKGCGIPFPSGNAPYGSANDSVTDEPALSIRQADLSGCYRIREEAFVTFAKLLPFLTELRLDKYARTKYSVPFEQRDHLYRITPLHGLASVAADFSDNPSAGLMLSDTVLEKIITLCPCLETLSLQYQHLNDKLGKAIGKLKYLNHLDITSCRLASNFDLPNLLKQIGHQLRTLKMLYVSWRHFTLIAILVYAKDLHTLHLTCANPEQVRRLADPLRALAKLQNFRLTLVGGGTVDPLISCINPTSIRRIDISPRLDLHPRHSRKFPLVNASDSTVRSATTDMIAAEEPPPLRALTIRRKSIPRNIKTIQNSHIPTSYSRTETLLQLTDDGLEALARFDKLCELRLCFPNVTGQALARLLRDLPHLQILELRLDVQRSKAAVSPLSNTQQQQSSVWRNHTDEMDDKNAVDLLEDAAMNRSLPDLRELHLYHVWMGDSTAESLCGMRRLRVITLFNCGGIIERKPDIIQRWITTIPMLETLRIGRMSFKINAIDNYIQLVDCTEDKEEEELLQRFRTSAIDGVSSRRTIDSELKVTKINGTWQRKWR